jgi:hypothetical protein
VTQRPQMVHENVLSQCDNLVLMRSDFAVARLLDPWGTLDTTYGGNTVYPRLENLRTAGAHTHRALMRAPLPLILVDGRLRSRAVG